MKRLTLAMLVFLLVVPLVYGQKTRLGQAPPKAKSGVGYPLKAHVSGIHIRTECDVFSLAPHLLNHPCDEYAFVDTTIDGQKMELMGKWSWVPGEYQTPLAVGDLQARRVKEAAPGANSPLYRQYELLLPDKTAWRCEVRGYDE